jgi:methionyl-tRNA formyltransferase
MKIVMFCNPHANQKALANKIHFKATLSKIVLCTGDERKRSSRQTQLERLWKMFCIALTLAKFRRTWYGMLNYYDEIFPKFPIEPALTCHDINDESVIQLVEKEKPDLVVVSGTNILRKFLIEKILKHGKAINLHTGISPYVKGGPNCTNWCLYLKEFDIIGNTVMWLDAGIDSGNIIATARTPLNGRESLLDLHIKVIDHAHDLYVKAIVDFINMVTLPNIPQAQFDCQRLFLSKNWSLYQMIKSLLNFYFLFKPESKFFKSRKDATLITY